MATFTGVILPNLEGETYITLDTDVRQTFYDTGLLPDEAQFVDVTDLEIGDLVDNGFQTFAQNHSGGLCEGYAAIFYNRIIIDPNPLQIGNIVSDQALTISVFNAFFTDTTLDSITETNVAGIELVGPATPTVFSPLQEIIYDVNVSVSEGPPTIDGTYLYDFAGGIADVLVSLVGARVLPLPYLFQAGLSETLNWKTKVMTSNDGSEQRMKLRGSPRQEFAFNIAIPNGNHPELDSLLYTWRGNNFGLPISSECRPLTSPTSISSPNIDVSTEFADFRVGGLIMIFNTPADFELAEIVSFTTSQIITTQNITKVFGTSALVMPVRIARLLSDPVRNFNGTTQRLNARFRVTDNTSLAVVAAPDQYKGLDVYLEQPLTISRFATDKYTARVDVVDFGAGVADTFTPWIKTKVNRVFGLQFDDAEDAWNYRLWLHRREGKLRPFWMPTFEHDFELLSTGGLVQTLIVADEGQLNLSNERNDIAIRTTSGWLFREILTLIQQGDDLQLGLDSPLSIDASEVEFISFMGRKRLTSDNLEISWANNNTGRVSVPITEINN
ncbi:MAG: hypothetical protein JKY62_16745 [Desulfocapsa sp.]|nr:hypothetical protein [Desulfocapsa sp.]